MIFLLVVPASQENEQRADDGGDANVDGGRRGVAEGEMRALASADEQTIATGLGV
jgi:hypothetical protein